MPLSTTQLHDQLNNLTTLKELGKKVLVFVYPKDNTPGCTIENRDFSHLKDKFTDLGIEPVGISPDTAESHSKFCNMHGLNTTLLADPDMLIIKQLGAYGDKKMYGKVLGAGVIRSSYLIDTTTDTILQTWPNARAVGHASRVLKDLTK